MAKTVPVSQKFCTWPVRIYSKMSPMLARRFTTYTTSPRRSFTRALNPTLSSSAGQRTSSWFPPHTSHSSRAAGLPASRSSSAIALVVGYKLNWEINWFECKKLKMFSVAAKHFCDVLPHFSQNFHAIGMSFEVNSVSFWHENQEDSESQEMYMYFRYMRTAPGLFHVISWLGTVSRVLCFDSIFHQPDKLRFGKNNLGFFHTDDAASKFWRKARNGLWCSPLGVMLNLMPIHQKFLCRPDCVKPLFGTFSVSFFHKYRMPSSSFCTSCKY